MIANLKRKPFSKIRNLIVHRRRRHHHHHHKKHHRRHRLHHLHVGTRKTRGSHLQIGKKRLVNELFEGVFNFYKHDKCEIQVKFSKVNYGAVQTEIAVKCNENLFKAKATHEGPVFLLNAQPITSTMTLGDFKLIKKK